MFWTPVSPKKKEAPEPEERGEIANVSEEARGGLSLLNLLPSYACVVSGERTVLWANQAMKRDMGLVPGMRCFEVHWLREEPCGECPLEMVASTGKSFCWEQSIENPQTGKIQVLSQLISLPWGFARGRCFLEISTDVTLFKRRQSQLELSQREYKALFEGVPCYISVQDRDFRIIKTNGLFQKEFGRAIGRKCYEVYKGRDKKCDPCPVERTFVDGQIHFSEETVRRRSGEPMEVVVYTAPIKDNWGTTYAVMEMSTEITPVKTLQRELASLGQAVAITAHSIKNILGGLDGGAYVVRSALRRNDPELTEKGLSMIQEGVEMARRLLQDILLVSRHGRPKLEDISPVNLALEVISLFQKRAGDLGIELQLETMWERNLTFRGDHKGLHTALANLLSNAIDACASLGAQGPGKVFLRVHELEEVVCFQVEDNGPGVPEEIKEKLFREMVTTKGNAGTGLGLIVTNKIVKEHGGHLRYRSSPRGGTIFEIMIPRKPVFGEKYPEQTGLSSG
jgi:PAS domain S-box-containing protein